MDVFGLDRGLLGDYERFARSFTEIRSTDIRSQVDALYASRRFWPDPLVTINPHFERDVSVDTLVESGSLHPCTAQVFRVGDAPITLHRHQAQAMAKAKASKSFVVTTGTGSGKSLCFFIPIIDAAIRGREAGEARRTRAIVVYPMNALANSQIKELGKFVEQSGVPEDLRPTFERYTGQESSEEKERIRKAKPDILLTNFMMLELLMTRQDELDQQVMSNAQGLDFIVLDELHTYRGRQGADVAMLVRRVRDRLCPDREPICIGTSATMASEGSEGERAAAVAEVASRLFGTDVPVDSVIDESLERATEGTVDSDAVGRAIDSDPPAALRDDELRAHPLAVWIEMEIGLLDGQRLARRPPVTLTDAAARLAAATGRDEQLCMSRLQAMLMMMSRPASERGGNGERAFLAFKLHRFISGAGHVYTTLSQPGQRRVTLDGQRFDPKDPTARLYPTFFCRSCGQEYHPVTLADDSGVIRALPRPIDEVPIEDENQPDQAGYLMPEPEDDADFTFAGRPEDYPDDWVEAGRSGPKLRSNRRGSMPRRLSVSQDGAVGAAGRPAWFLPGKFKFCLACRHQPPGQAREINKLAGLSAEGRSSATTLLVSSVLRWMNAGGSGVPDDKRKLLGFTDNRQDAALQAGHFNDFVFVSLLRAATLAAVRREGEDGLAEEDFGRRVQQALGFTAANRDRRREWMFDPEAVGPSVLDAERTLSRVLAHRVWVDLRRGWRFTNPNLEELGLIRVDYVGLEDLVADEARFAEAPEPLRSATPEVRRRALRELLDGLRTGLAVTADALEPTTVEATANASRQRLREPWSISQQESPRSAAALMIDPPHRTVAGVRGESLIVRGSARSRIGRLLSRSEIWGQRLDAETYLGLVEWMLGVTEAYEMVRAVDTVYDGRGWRLAANAVRLLPGEGRADGREGNVYFVDLYRSLADDLAAGGGFLFGLEGREHTAQVEQNRRLWREARFRWEDEDRATLAKAREEMRQAGEPDVPLPAMFCSPTMELGVDISALNAVYLRNVPPTPANYAQRSGRAGRSGQAALVVTYCAAQGPHDQYYFQRRAEMVGGVVRPPAIELANRDLIEAHLHAVWLAETGKELSPDIPAVLDLQRDALPLRDDIAEAVAAPDLRERAADSMTRVLLSVAPELTHEKAPWAKDPAALADATARNAAGHFSAAFERWRELYKGARVQLMEANRRTEMHGLGAEERKTAKRQQAQANEQIALLERSNAGNGSDFFTYRYLATEGFLPGYNFPRLPLYAYVPAVGVGRATRAAYLQRARFLAIAEFGPLSLIYHEGRAFRVHKAKLSPDTRTDEEGRLITGTIWICGECGAAHRDGEPERCHACDTAMDGVHPVRNVLRIDNVESSPAERITANDEERQRRGFEIQTVFSWPLRDGAFDVTTVTARDGDGDVLRLDYASGATVCRLNKGLRRRKERSILGFGIDPATGRWIRNPGEHDGDQDPDGPIRQRIVPIVQDTKNAALLRPAAGAISDTAMTTLQHALARGIWMVFQLEEAELLTEPVPSREERRAILAFEATEGGAGVLGRLTAESGALARVARRALGLMHYLDIDEAVEVQDPARLREDPDADCVKGCYGCLLSYYNQPDHELIDRTDEEVRRMLLRLARSEVVPRAPDRADATGSLSEWRRALGRWGLPPADDAPIEIGGTALPLAWRSYMAAATFEPLDDSVCAAAEARGFIVIALPEQPGDQPPPALVEILGGAA